jgi:hypothetical protein
VREQGLFKEKAAPKKRDFIFEGLCEAFGVDPKKVSDIERGPFNKAAKSLVQKGYKRDDSGMVAEIKARARRFLEVKRLQACAPNAVNLVKYWAQCKPVASAGGYRAFPGFSPQDYLDQQERLRKARERDGNKGAPA